MPFFKLTFRKFLLTILLFCFSFSLFILTSLISGLGSETIYGILLTLLSYILSLPAHVIHLSWGEIPDKEILMWLTFTSLFNLLWNYFLICVLAKYFKK
jgi:hypothetical protein